jgi:integral membrane sensor domain MASE1
MVARKRLWLAGCLGALLLIELIVLLVALAPLMASSDTPATGPTGASEPVPVDLPWATTSLREPTLFVVVSLVGGALGGALHGVASLTAHVAQKDFSPSWTLWYLSNPVVGAALAAAFLFVLQAGLGGQAASSAPTGLYGIAAVATLTGLFSRHALDKLKEIFDVAFARSSPTRADRESNMAGSGSGAPPVLPGRDGASPVAGTHNPVEAGS